MNMKKELSIKQIREDFINKVMLSENEIDILERYVKNHSIVKMAEDTKQGTATISRIIASIKEKYEDYRKLEIAKLMLLTTKNDKR